MKYIRGSVEELHHVRWPTRQQAVRLSVIVIVFVLASSVLVGVIDAILTEVVQIVLG